MWALLEKFFFQVYDVTRSRDSQICVFLTYFCIKGKNLSRVPCVARIDQTQIS